MRQLNHLPRKAARMAGNFSFPPAMAMEYGFFTRSSSSMPMVLALRAGEQMRPLLSMIREQISPIAPFPNNEFISSGSK